jgi:serum/glucocorticoid-regulated kinase 2
VITNKGIYNLKKKCKINKINKILKTALKRRIEIEGIRGITVSKIIDDFVIHGNDDEYDYHYVSQRRKRIIEYIAKAFRDLTGQELKFCEVEIKSLKGFVTSKNEKKKDKNFSKMPKTLTSVYLYLNPDAVGNDPEQPIKSRTLRTTTLYSKRKDNKEVKLEDFQVLKVLGRGSFGKVCLVEYAATKEIYAMKSLKKDVLIDQDQIENTLLEKRILESLDHAFLVDLIFCFQTEERLYFIMPFLRGGELFQHLRKFRIFVFMLLKLLWH